MLIHLFFFTPCLYVSSCRFIYSKSFLDYSFPVGCNYLLDLRVVFVVVFVVFDGNKLCGHVSDKSLSLPHSKVDFIIIELYYFYIPKYTGVTCLLFHVTSKVNDPRLHFGTSGISWDNHLDTTRSGFVLGYGKKKT